MNPRFITTLISAIASIIAALIATFGVIKASHSGLEDAKKNVDEAKKALLDANESVAKILSDPNRVKPPIGMVVSYAGAIDREDLKSKGWLLCDGASLSVAEYPELHKAISFAWGGDKSKNFNLPDLQGRFLRGVESEKTPDPNNSDRTPSRDNGNAGNQVGSVQADAVKSHVHPLVLSPFGGNPKNVGLLMPTGNRFDAENMPHPTNLVRENTADSNQTAKETRPKNANVNWIIKAK